MPKPSFHGGPHNNAATHKKAKSAKRVRSHKEADTALVHLLFHLGIRLPTCDVTFIFRDGRNVNVQFGASCSPAAPGPGADDDVLGTDSIEKHLEALLAASGKKAPKHGAIRYEMRNRRIRDIEVRLRERQEL